MTTRTPRASWPSRRRVPLIAGITVFLLLLGGGGARAYWTTAVAAPGSLATQSVSVAQANVPTLSASYLPSSLTSTGVFTITNTGGLAGTATAQVSAAGAFAAGLPIQAWTVAAPGDCTAAATPPGGAVSGTWGSLTLTAGAAAGASVHVCVRTAIPDWKPLAVVGGTQAVSPSVQVSLDADGWIAAAAPATSTQQTAGMHPLTTGFFDAQKSRWFTVRAKAASTICLDVADSAGSGGRLISWTCHTMSNQRWEFIPVTGADQSLVTIRPRHAMSTRVSADSAGVQKILTADAGSLSQQWYVQQLDATTSQLVSAATGMCLNLRGFSSSGDMSTVTCDTAPAQIALTREPLTLITGSTISIGFGSQAPGVVTLQRWSGGAWSGVAVTASNAASVSFARDTHLPDGETTLLRIVNASGETVWDGIQLARSGTTVTAVSGIG
jgi:hypothetical protein